MNNETHESTSNSQFSDSDYNKILQKLDAAICEALSVGQACSGRPETPAIGYSTHIFTRICAHAQSMICAIPRSRWVKRDFEIWDVSSIASHARSILEGYLLFRYLADAPSSLDIQRMYVQVMNLYDCTKRINILPHVLPVDEVNRLKRSAEELKARLEGIEHFRGLEAPLKKDILAGKKLMIDQPKDLIARLGINQAEFDFFWNYLSQYTHVLSFTFYRIEPNGRGTGSKNGFDRDALCMVMLFCTGILIAAVDRLVELFPDTATARNGTESKFAPGPLKNLPKHLKRDRKKKRWG